MMNIMVHFLIVLSFFLSPYNWILLRVYYILFSINIIKKHFQMTSDFKLIDVSLFILNLLPTNTKATSIDNFLIDFYIWHY